MNNPAGVVDNLVIGGGLAGAMVAIRLASAGRGVALLEKERFPHHKVCGEFLSPEAVDYLRQVAIDPLALGAANIRSVRLSSRQRVAESALPFTALSLSRFALDQAMLTRAEQSGCTVHRGILVDGLATDGDLWQRNSAAASRYLPAPSFSPAGSTTSVVGPARAAVQGDLVAFKLHWRLEPAQTEALREFIELFLFAGGYGGLSLVEEDAANLCLVVHRARLRAIGNWPALLVSILDENQLLRRRLQGAKPLWPRPLALSSIPYGYLSAQACRTMASWRSGGGHPLLCR